MQIKLIPRFVMEEEPDLGTQLEPNRKKAFWLPGSLYTAMW